MEEGEAGEVHDPQVLQGEKLPTVCLTDTSVAICVAENCCYLYVDETS